MTKISLALGTSKPVEAGVAVGKSLFAQIAAVVRLYAQLAKPGIVMGNLIATVGGFFLVAHWRGDPFTLLAVGAGVALTVASGCVFNNYIDRDIDAKMRRTWNRALVRGLVTPRAALIYASLLGVCGVCILGVGVNALCAALVVAGFAVYVGVYSLYMKRHSTLGTLIGSLSGAMPPVIGYCAARGRLDAGAGLLLLVFALWQMPHSYAIAIVYLDDYAAAGIPVVPVRYGVPAAKRQIVLYIIAFVASIVALAGFGYAGPWYLIVVGGVGLYWLYGALAGYHDADARGWARQMFIFSIVSVMTLSLMPLVSF